MTRPLRVVFFGSPAAAVPTLDAIRAAGHDVLAVVTQPDRPVGRKQVVTPCPVAARGRELGLQVLQPEKVRGGDFRERISALAPDVAVVVAYVRILPGPLLALPELGFLNVHFSLLPRWRGASPVAAAIAAGDERTGVSIMRLDEGLDTGPVLALSEVAIGARETTGELTERLARLGADLLVEVLRRFAAREPPAEAAQDEARATLCRPLAKDDGRVDWSRSAAELDRRRRAFDPWPGVFTELAGERVRILDGEPVAGSGAPGVVVDLGAVGPVVATGEGAWLLRQVQPAGRGAMSGADFARGRRLETGTRFS